MKQYHNILQDILTNGNQRIDRTGTGTYSVFGREMRFNLAEGFPLVTTKKVPIRLIIEELLWFLSGSTNNKELIDKNVHIWDQWSVPEFLEIPLNKHERFEIVNASSHFYDYLALTGKREFSEQTEEMREKQKIAWCRERDIPTTKKVPHPQAFSLGPIYSKQWRSWVDTKIVDVYNGEYKKYLALGYVDNTDFYFITRGEPPRDKVIITKEFDQIAELVKGLKEKPFSRRHLVSTWNVADLPDESISPQDNVMNGKMALAPCHVMFQFYVELLKEEERSMLFTNGSDAVVSSDVMNAATFPKYKLSCKLYQRSADFPLGVPFNIASYALLTMMVAQCVGMAPGDFIHSFGDCHIYAPQVEGIKEQLTRQPLPLPTMKINPDKTDIFSFTIDDFKLEGYQHHPAISFPVAV
jgi:thymidylate synthase